MSKKISGGLLIAKALSKENVNYVFSLSGGHINPIYKGLVDEDIKLITMRHEQAAGNAAEGWAKTTRTPGVCLVTAGPGFSNVMPALISAYYAHSPVVCITGHTALRDINRHAAQEVDHIPIARPITKYAEMVYSTKRVPEYVQEAFRHANAGNMGPTLIDIPVDIQTLEVEEEKAFPFYMLNPQNYRTQGVQYPDPHLVKQAAKVLLSASNPIIIAGSGVYWGRAEKSLLALAEYLSIPVSCDDLGKGCIPDNHPLAIGNAVQNLLLGKADVILALGVIFGEYQGFGINPMFYKEDCKVIFVDPDPSSLGKNRPFKVGIASSIDPFLKLLLSAVKDLESKTEIYGEWARMAKKDRLELEEMLCGPIDSNDVPIKPQRLTKDIQEFLDENTRLFLDGGDTTVWAQLILKSGYAGQIIGTHGPTGHLGAGLPMCIAAKLAEPEKHIMLLTGDGSFLFNGVEIDTATRYDLPVTIIIENDSLWGMIAHNQDLSWGERIGTTLDDKGHIDYVKFAESLGGTGELVTKPSDITEAIKRARTSDRVYVIDVRVDGDVTNILNQRAAAKAEPSFWE
ncbi:MAG: thiamine pyrophosphate-binding protein [Candidatus Hodarchaeales archaeon]